MMRTIVLVLSGVAGAIQSPGAVLKYSTGVGGADTITTIAAAVVDSQGYLYVAGTTSWNGFPANPVPQSVFPSKGLLRTTVFVQKIQPGTYRTVYSVLVGGSGDQNAAGIAVDAEGNVYVTGWTDSNDFPLAPRPSTRSDQDTFVFALNPTGTALVFARLLGGTGADAGSAIARGPDGSVTIVGATDSSDFPVTPDALQSSLTPAQSLLGDNDAFVLRLSSSGATIQYSTYLGGPGNDFATGVAVDANGDTYVTGYAGAYFPTLASSYAPILPDGGFVSKISRLNGQLAYSTYLPGTTINGDGLPLGANNFSVVADSEGNTYVVGTAGPGFPATPGAFQTNIAGGSDDVDAFLLELNPAGTALVFATLIGSPGPDSALGVTLLGDTIAIAGATSSTAFPVTDYGTPFCDLDAVAAFDGFTPYGAFVSQFDGSGRLLSSAAYSYCNGEIPSTISLSASGTIYIAGSAYFGSAYFLAELDLGASLPNEISAVTDSASFSGGPFAPLELISIFGKGLGPQAAATANLVNGILPTTLAGIQVFAAGQPAPLLFVSEKQINAILPQNVGPFSATSIEVSVGGSSTEIYTTFIDPTSPALFTSNGQGFGQAAVLNQDGTVNSPQNPAPRGSIIALFGTGAGTINPPFRDGQVVTQAAPLTDTGYFIVGLDLATVTYAGAAPGLVNGVVQVNVQIPMTTTPGPAVPVRWALLAEDGCLDFFDTQPNVTVAIQ